MGNSKRQTPVRKPAKLDQNWRQQWGDHPEFPLFPHWSNRWAKKVRGNLHYFRKIADDPKGENALKLWADQKDDLLAGCKPRGKSDGLVK
jgi:hypothetical protein